VRRTQRRRPAAGHTPVGLVLEASTRTAGVPGTAATWVAPTGAPATRALGCGGRTSCGCVETVCARSPREPGPCFFVGARCAAWPIVKAPPPKKKVAVAVGGPGTRVWLALYHDAARSALSTWLLRGLPRAAAGLVVASLSGTAGRCDFRCLHAGERAPSRGHNSRLYLFAAVVA
jgi:hypothetical protein